MKQAKPVLFTYVWRGFLILLLACGTLAFGVRYSRARYRSGTALPTWSGRPMVQGQLAFEPLEQSRLVRCYDSVLNGQKTQFGHFRSTLPARNVVDQFEARYGRMADRTEPTRGTMVRVVTRRYAMAGAIDSEGRHVGLVAFEDPKAGGSTYFVGRTAERPKGWRHGDVPGEEVPGIPRPLRSRRVLCIDGIGGIPSRLIVYEGWGDISDTITRFQTEMPKAGWKQNADVERIVQKQLPGVFLSFLKGTRRAMIYIERENDTNKVRTAVAYSVKDWLPPDRGL